MRAIEHIEIGGIADKRFVISNAGLAAMLDIGTNWTRIRILARLAVDDPDGNITGTPRLCLGVMSNPSAGLANGPHTASTSHFVGVFSINSTWFRNGGPPVRFAPSFQSGKKVGETFTGSNNVSANQSAEPDSIRKYLMTDIVRGDPFTVRVGGVSTASWNNDDLSLSRIEAALEMNEFSGANSANTFLGGAGGAAVNVTVDEDTDGPLNAIVCSWNKEPNYRISDLLWTHFSN